LAISALALGFASAALGAGPLDSSSAESLLGTPSLPAEIVALLRENRKTYGEDAVVLQLQLLRNAIHADSILAAGVRVDGVKPHSARRYLAYTVETGIVFNTRQTDRSKRLDHVWSRVVLPSLVPLKVCDVPADGVALELTYFHQPYDDTASFQATVQEHPGESERVVFYLLRDDIVAFNRNEVDAAGLYGRAEPAVDGTPLAAPLPPSP
jgi:hypothetical protein